ncbi:hypothetical protein EON63_22590 [archaeon]|nr:MAG: hypothetical protein EON63_22590 [archaeon]
MCVLLAMCMCMHMCSRLHRYSNLCTLLIYSNIHDSSGEFQDSIGQVWNPILQYYRGGHPDVEHAKQSSLYAINASIHRYDWENITRAEEIVSEVVRDNLLIKDNMTIGHAGTHAAMSRMHSNIHLGAPDYSKNYTDPLSSPPPSSGGMEGGGVKGKGRYAHLPSLSTNEVYAYIQEPRKDVVHVTTFVYLENVYNKTLLHCAREMVSYIKSHIEKEGWGHRVVFTLMCASSGGSERLARGVGGNEAGAGLGVGVGGESNSTSEGENKSESEVEGETQVEEILKFNDWMESKGLNIPPIVKNKEQRDELIQAKKDYQTYLDNLPPATLRAHELRRMERWERWYTYRKAKEEEAKAAEVRMGLGMGVAGRSRRAKKVSR